MNAYKRITSKDNNAVKDVVSLQRSAKERRNRGLFVLEGLRLCTDAADNGHIPQSVFLSDTAAEKYRDETVKIASTAKNVHVLPDSLFEKISDTVSPQGILCLYSIPTFDLTKLKRTGRYIALENLQDPSNLGAVARTAEAFGIDGMILCGGCDPYSPKSLRASMGALLRIPVITSENVFDVISPSGLKSYGAVVSDETVKAGDVDFPDGCVVIIGNEANGLTAETILKCDEKITIPMRGKAESLNAAVAASVLMWEMCK